MTWLNCFSWEKPAHPLLLPSERRVISFQNVSWEMFSPAPHHLATLAGVRRLPRLSEIPSQAWRCGNSSGHWRGSAGGLNSHSLWCHSLSPCTALCAMRDCRQNVTELHSCFGEPQRGEGQMERCVTGCQGAAPAHSECCSPPLLRFLLANGTLPKWRGGEGCKPKLHL